MKHVDLVLLHGPCALHSSKHAGRLLLQIHDELIWEVDADAVADAARVVRERMERLPLRGADGFGDLPPLPVSVVAGPSCKDASRLSQHQQDRRTAVSEESFSTGSTLGVICFRISVTCLIVLTAMRKSECGSG